MKKTIEIPEGYTARIEGNKVIFELKESEDEMIRKALIELVRKHCVNETRCMMEEWLENKVKSDISQTKQEWSEEDETNSKDVLTAIDELYGCNNEKTGGKELHDWFILFKSRIQPQWKPSDEQMNALKWYCEVYMQQPGGTGMLTSLYNDLKKLRGK